eukprot:g5543.t1
MASRGANSFSLYFPHALSPSLLLLLVLTLLPASVSAAEWVEAMRMAINLGALLFLTGGCITSCAYLITGGRHSSEQAAANGGRAGDMKRGDCFFLGKPAKVVRVIQDGKAVVVVLETAGAIGGRSKGRKGAAAAAATRFAVQFDLAHRGGFLLFPTLDAELDSLGTAATVDIQLLGQVRLCLAEQSHMSTLKILRPAQFESPALNVLRDLPAVMEAVAGLLAQPGAAEYLAEAL